MKNSKGTEHDKSVKLYRDCWFELMNHFCISYNINPSIFKNEDGAVDCDIMVKHPKFDEFLSRYKILEKEDL